MTVQLIREGFDPVELQLCQVTPAAVCALFSIDAQTVYLKSEFGPKAFFPDPSNTSFGFTDDVADSVYSFRVEGMPTSSLKRPQHDMRPLAISSMPSSSQASTGRVGFGFSHSTPSSSMGRKSGNSSTLKVIQANVSKNVNGKLEFFKIGQMFITLYEPTATVDYITAVIQKRWGKEYIIVTSDGLPIEDSSGTQGLKFWRVGSRKVYAVDHKMVRRDKGKKRKVATSDSESDNDSRRKGSTSGELLRELSKLRKEVLAHTAPTPHQERIYQRFSDSFKCNICLCIIKPPLIYALCCRHIVGCDKCVSECRRQNNKCPLCRAEPWETIPIIGFDDLLNELSLMFNSDEMSTTTSSSSGVAMASNIYRVPSDEDSSIDDDFQYP